MKLPPPQLHPEWCDRSDDAQVLRDAITRAEADGTVISSSEQFRNLRGALLGLPVELSKYDQVEYATTWTANMWAWWQWQKAGKVILHMDEKMTRMLASTELPRGKLGDLPRLPWDGFYITIPPLFSVTDLVTGKHLVEGIYVAKDRIRSRADEEVGDGLLFMAIGEDKNNGKDPWGRDDVCLYHAQMAQRELDIAGAFAFDEGLGLATRIAWNFLMLFNSTSKSLLQFSPKEHALPRPKSPGKRKVLARRLASRQHLPYLDVTLRSRSRAAGGTPVGEEAGLARGETHETLVRGFWRRHWMKRESMPEGTQILGTRTHPATGTELVSVWKFIPPHMALRYGEAKERRELRVR